jgi:hypothetical protein
VPTHARAGIEHVAPRRLVDQLAHAPDVAADGLVDQLVSL